MAIPENLQYLIQSARESSKKGDDETDSNRIGKILEYVSLDRNKKIKADKKIEEIDKDVKIIKDRLGDKGSDKESDKVEEKLTKSKFFSNNFGKIKEYLVNVKDTSLKFYKNIGSDLKTVGTKVNKYHKSSSLDRLDMKKDFKKHTNSIYLSLKNKISSALRTLFEPITKTFKFVKDLFSFVKGAVVLIIKSIVIGFKVAVFTIMTAIKSLTLFIKTILFLGGLLLFLLTPPGIFLTLGILITFLVKNKKFRDMFFELVESLKQKAIDWLSEYIPEPFVNAIDFIATTAIESLKGVVNFIKDIFQHWDNPSWWVEKLQGLGNWIIDKFFKWGDILLGPIVKLGDYLIGIGEVLWDEIMLPFGEIMWDYTPDWLKDTIKWVGEKFLTSWNWFDDNIVQPVLTKLASWFGLIPGFSEAASEAADEYAAAREEGHGRVASGLQSAGAMMGLRKSRAERAEEFSKISEQADSNISFSLLESEFSKLIGIAQLYSGKSPTQSSNFAKDVSEDLGIGYNKDNPPDNTIKSIANSGLEWGKFISFIFPPSANGLDLLSYAIETGAYKDVNGRAFEVLNESVDFLLEIFSNKFGDLPPFSLESINKKLTLPPPEEVVAFSMGGIVTDPTHAYIAESGHHEAVIPLNDKGVEFMKNTMMSAIKSLNIESPKSVSVSENKVESKLDSLIRHVSDLTNNLTKETRTSNEPPESQIDNTSDFTKMIAAGIIGSRNGGI